MVFHSILVKIMVYSELRTTLLLLVFDFLSVICFMLFQTNVKLSLTFIKWEVRRKSKHFREWRGGGEPVYLEESLHVFEMLQNIWQGMISSSSCSCSTYFFAFLCEILRNHTLRIRRRENMDCGGWEDMQGKGESYRSRFVRLQFWTYCTWTMNILVSW